LAQITPKYKVILTYDVKAMRQADYSQFVLGTFIPAVQSLGLHITGAYHTVHGDYPSRQAEFVAESWETVLHALQSERFEELEATLKSYTLNYNRKLVKYRRGFQF